MIKRIKHLVDKSAFGVCTFWGSYLGIASSKIRLYFIYITMLTVGSPIVVYLFFAFWINIKKFVRRQYHPVMD